MEQKQKAALKQSRKLTEQEIRGLLTEYGRQNSTVKEFCKLHDVREWAFYAWKKKYELTVKKDSGEPGFVALQVQETEDVLFAEVVDEKGRCIRIFKQVDPSYLQALLA
jgi:hypothetical protein